MNAAGGTYESIKTWADPERKLKKRAFGRVRGQSFAYRSDLKLESKRIDKSLSVERDGDNPGVFVFSSVLDPADRGSPRVRFGT